MRKVPTILLSERNTHKTARSRWFYLFFNVWVDSQWDMLNRSYVLLVGL